MKNSTPIIDKKENILDQVGDTCYYVSEHSKYVRINKDNLKMFVLENEFAKTAHWLSSNPFSLLDLDIKDIVNFLIIYDAIDCSFWGNPKWTIDSEKEKLDGAFALMYALLKLRNKKGHLNFEEISFNEFKEALKGNVEIPLLKERYEVVLEVSKIINLKMNGNFYQYVKDITDDLSLFYTIIENFPSFEDKREYEGKVVYFYKLAQLATSDILHIRKLKENINIDCSHLVGCADYKIPQILRGIGFLEYDEELSNLVDNKCEIAENSIYEVEIRANMIVSIDLIKKELNEEIDAIEINDIIWSLGQDKSREFLPYHLTRTLSY